MRLLIQLKHFLRIDIAVIFSADPLNSCYQVKYLALQNGLLFGEYDCSWFKSDQCRKSLEKTFVENRLRSFVWRLPVHDRLGFHAGNLE